jgi:hypothetical protein
MFVVCVALALIVLAEKRARRAVEARDARDKPVYFYSDNLYEEDPFLGYRLGPNRTAFCTEMLNGAQAFECKYSTDSLGRRTTPVSSAMVGGRFIAFFGCSYVFGEGVNDDQTLPAEVARRVSDWQAYNYGVPGYGPQQMLAKFQSGELAQEIGQEKGVFVYVYTDDHPRRVIGAMNVFLESGRAFPYYDYVNGQLTYLGNFNDGRPYLTRLYVNAGRSSILRLLGVDFPGTTPLWAFRMISDMALDSAQIANGRWAGSEFYVLFFSGASDRHGSGIISKLREDNVSVLDYRRLLDEMPIERRCFCDGRPRPEAYAAVAEKLIADLKLR